MMTSTNNPGTTAPNHKESAVRRPLQVLNVNSKARRTGVLGGDDTKAHIVKPRPAVNFVTAIEVTPASSAEMSVSQVKKYETESSECLEDQLNSIFREASLEWGESRDSAETDERQELWTLKRASPVMEQDDDDESSFAFESPSKKSKVETIYWDTHLSTDKPFDLTAMMRSS